jgi:hypothetical protein
MNLSCSIALAAFVLVAGTFSHSVSAQNETPATVGNSQAVKPNLPSKKLIEYGWDDYLEPDLIYIRDNIREMEKRPFNGMVFRLPDSGGEVFNLKAWDQKKLLPQLKILSQIKWDKFTDNFVAILALPESATVTTDWFSDDAWKKVLNHTQFMSHVANISGCKGIMFDPEGDQLLWSFGAEKKATGRSFDDYASQARKRGSQFMRALMTEKPDVKVLMLHHYTRFSDMTQSTDPAKRAQVVRDDTYALLPSFIDGMIEVAGDRAQIIDGNEPAYWYRSPLEYYQSSLAMHQGNKAFAAPDVRDKYDRSIRAGQALYIDWVFNLRPDFLDYNLSIGMSPEDRLRWFEQNAYYALKTSDEYVWVYGEKLNWWKNEAIPSGLEAALISAKGKIERGEELGFEVPNEVFMAADAKRRSMK